MSNVSSAHNVTAFDAKKSQALTGQRLAKIGYKSTKGKAPKFPSVCVSVPFVDMNEAITEPMVSRLASHIRGMLESAQDGIIRSLYESSDGRLSSVTDTDISLDACVKFLDAEAAGGRLTKEFLAAWYGENVSEVVYVLIAEKLGYDGTLTPEQETTIARHSNAYRDLIGSLSGGATILQPNQIKSLQSILAMVTEDDTSRKLSARLVQMTEKPVMAELLEL